MVLRGTNLTNQPNGKGKRASFYPFGPDIEVAVQSEWWGGGIEAVGKPRAAVGRCDFLPGQDTLCSHSQSGNFEMTKEGVSCTISE